METIHSFLSKPEAGWTNFTPGDKVYELSYITNVPMEWLRAAIIGVKNDVPFVVSGDMESSGRIFCAVTDLASYIFHEDGNIFEPIEIGKHEFCNILCNDLRKNIDDWISWYEGNEGLLDKIQELETELKLCAERDAARYKHDPEAIEVKIL